MLTDAERRILSESKHGVVFGDVYDPCIRFLIDNNLITCGVSSDPDDRLAMTCHITPYGRSALFRDTIRRLF